MRLFGVRGFSLGGERWVLRCIGIACYGGCHKAAHRVSFRTSVLAAELEELRWQDEPVDVFAMLGASHEVFPAVEDNQAGLALIWRRRRDECDEDRSAE
ncbi:MAG: hypothetical protein BWY57_01953 [Betaproteobacteria bacterium ADurb.Bin341]|nr:MAG: hypothetical protein BWY57_01953 [Betaproteobacteria bacterium ADurb.Bin341]